MTYSAIVRSYRMRNRSKADRERAFYRSKPFTAAIAAAALALNANGRRHSHQTRIPKASLEGAREILISNMEALKATGDFHELLEAVERFTGDIWGLGELYSYDTALRIGANLGLAPDRIYLHRGTRDGALALGLDHRAPWLEARDLPPEFHEFSPEELEDILCIYKKNLALARLNSTVRPTPTRAT